MDKNEALIRAREAVIASGHFPGAEEMIREGCGDDWHVTQAAFHAALESDKPIDELRNTKTVHIIYKDREESHFFLRRGFRNFLVSIREIFSEESAMERLERTLQGDNRSNQKLLSSRPDLGDSGTR